MNRRQYYRSAKNPNDLPDFVNPIVDSEATTSSNRPKTFEETTFRGVYDENDQIVLKPRPLKEPTQYVGPSAIAQTLFGSPFKQYNSPHNYANTDDQIKYNYELSRYEFYAYMRDNGLNPKDYYPFDPKYDMDPTNPGIHPRKKPKRFERPQSHTVYYPNPNNPPAQPIESHDKAAPTVADELRDETNKHIQEINDMSNQHDDLIHPPYQPSQPDINESVAESHTNPEFETVNLPPIQMDNKNETITYQPTVNLQTCKPSDDTAYELTLQDYNHLINKQIHKRNGVSIYDLIY